MLKYILYSHVTVFIDTPNVSPVLGDRDVINAIITLHDTYYFSTGV